MPARRRQSKRRANLAGPNGTLFLDSDGTLPTILFDDDAQHAYENQAAARAAWEQCRASTWAISYRGIWPPYAARVYDGITELTNKKSPRGRDWQLEELRQAVEADVASVEAFRTSEPAKAAEIIDELDDYLADLGYLLALGEQLTERNEEGYARELAGAWGTYEMRRKGEQLDARS